MDNVESTILIYMCVNMTVCMSYNTICQLLLTVWSKIFVVLKLLQWLPSYSNQVDFKVCKLCSNVNVIFFTNTETMSDYVLVCRVKVAMRLCCSVVKPFKVIINK